MSYQLIQMLIQYLKERDLYINEPTEGEVEF